MHINNNCESSRYFHGVIIMRVYKDAFMLLSRHDRNICKRKGCAITRDGGICERFESEQLKCIP